LGTTSHPVTRATIKLTDMLAENLRPAKVAEKDRSSDIQVGKIQRIRRERGRPTATNGMIMMASVIPHSPIETKKLGPNSANK